MNALDFLKDINASESQYHIDIAGLPKGLFYVTDIASISDELCNDYCFTIDILSAELLASDAIIGQDISLNILWGLADRTITGIVSHFVARGKSHQGFHYTLSLSSHLSLLKHKRSNRVFTSMSVEAILNSVFEKSGFPMSKLNMMASGPTLDMLVQYNETDYQFVDRIMRKFGFVYGVVETDSSPMVVIANSSADLASHSEPLDIVYQAPSGTVRASESIFAVSRKSTLLNNNTQLNDYNYEQPGNLSVEQNNSHEIAGFGESSIYGENYKDTAQGSHFAKIRQQAIDCQRDIFIIDSDCRAIRPGMIVNIVDHDDYSGSYFVIKVDHVGSQSGGVHYGSKVKNLHYKNQAHLVPAQVPFYGQVPQSSRVFTTFNATIEQEVDDKGRYIVKLPFNQDGEGEESKPTRMVQPYGGAGHGINFPLTKGTEVIVCGENGDLDRPIILGAVYNEAAVSPVNSANSHENLIVTRSGHSLLMDDQLGNEKIKLSNAEQANTLTLDATNGSHLAELKSKEGKINVQAKENLVVTAGADHLITAEKDVTVSTRENIKVETSEGDISLTSGRSITTKAGTGLSFEATENNLEMNAEAAILMQAQQDASLYAQEGNIDIKAAKADVSIEAGTNVVIKSTNNGSIHLSQGNGSIEIDAGGNLNIDANAITLSAKNIVIKGNAVSNN